MFLCVLVGEQWLRESELEKKTRRHCVGYCWNIFCIQIFMVLRIERGTGFSHLLSLGWLQPPCHRDKFRKSMSKPIHVYYSRQGDYFRNKLELIQTNGIGGSFGLECSSFSWSNLQMPLLFLLWGDVLSKWDIWYFCRLLATMRGKHLGRNWHCGRCNTEKKGESVFDSVIEPL